LNDWSDLLYSGDKANLKLPLFFCGKGKEAVFARDGLLTKNVLTLNNEVRSLIRKELKNRAEGR